MELYQINGIRSFLIAVSIARHGDLAGHIALMKTFYNLGNFRYNYHINILDGVIPN
jgi:hypothetical protein